MPFRRSLTLMLAFFLLQVTVDARSEAARAFRAREEASIPRGGWAHGSVNDYVLESDSAHLVIGGFPAETDADTVAPFRFGALLDLVPNLRHADGFGYLMPSLDDASGVVEMDSPRIAFSADGDGSASISVSRALPVEEGSFRTDYRLNGEMPGVMIETIVDREVRDGWAVSDRIAWGEYELFVPGIGEGLPEGVLVEGAEFLLGRRHADSILLVPETGTLSVRREGAVTTVRYEGFRLGDATRRWLLTGNDAGELLSQFLESQPDLAPASVSGLVRERFDDPGSGATWTRSANGASMLLALPGADGAARPYLPFRSQVNGRFRLLVPGGDYLVMPGALQAAGSAPRYMRLQLRSGQEAAELEFVLMAHPGLDIAARDAETGEAIAARFEFRGMDGTPSPDFGHDGGVHSRSTLFAATGEESVRIPPGRYEVRASRGIEFHPVTETIVIESGVPSTLDVELRRAYSTDGWLAGDIGSRTDAHPRSPTSEAARRASARAEGLDWIAPLNAGSDATGSVMRFVPVQLDADAAEPSGVSRDTAQRIWLPTEQEWADRASEGSSVMDDVRWLGVWDGSLPEAFGSRFQRVPDFRKAGRSFLPLGVSNAYTTAGEELGYPRVYVRAESADEVPQAMLAGKYQVTNGPFIELRINGEDVSGPVVASDGVLHFDLRVHAIDEVSVAKITVLVDGRMARQLLLNETLREAGSGIAVPTAGDPAAGQFRVTVTGDCVVDLVIEGDEDRPNPLISPRGSPFASTASARGTLSRAFHAPIHVIGPRDERANP